MKPPAGVAVERRFGDDELRSAKALLKLLDVDGLYQLGRELSPRGVHTEASEVALGLIVRELADRGEL